MGNHIERTTRKKTEHCPVAAKTESPASRPRRSKEVCKTVFRLAALPFIELTRGILRGFVIIGICLAPFLFLTISSSKRAIEYDFSGIVDHLNKLNHQSIPSH